MKILKMIALLAILVSVSCKKDKADESEAVEGHWHVSNFVPDGSSDTALLAQEVISILVEAECFPLEYSFTTEGKVTHIDKMNFLEVEEDESGVDVDCLFEDFFKDGTYSINDGVLTLNYDGETQVLNTNSGEDTLTILNAEFIFNDVKVSGKLDFTREEF